ncbi:hypothetical protein Q7313_21770, partial [Shouchella rhizosphaerae]|uniref:hypothetical protein n=1 Tax=Shouchella rhizosphaerae TaxID=866786 RepID=UPI002726A421
ATTDGKVVDSFNYTPKVTPSIEGEGEAVDLTKDTTLPETAQTAATKAGYKLNTGDNINQAALMAAKIGGTVTLYATKSDQVTMNTKVYIAQDGSVNPEVATTTTATSFSTPSAAENVIVTPTTAFTPFTGADGASYTAAQALSYLTGNATLKTL